MRGGVTTFMGMTAARRAAAGRGRRESRPGRRRGGHRFRVPHRLSTGPNRWAIARSPHRATARSRCSCLQAPRHDDQRRILFSAMEEIQARRRHCADPPEHASWSTSSSAPPSPQAGWLSSTTSPRAAEAEAAAIEVVAMAAQDRLPAYIVHCPPPSSRSRGAGAPARRADLAESCPHVLRWTRRAARACAPQRSRRRCARR